MAFGGNFSFGAKPVATVASSTAAPSFSFGLQPGQQSVATTSVTPALSAPLLSTTSSASTGFGFGLKPAASTATTGGLFGSTFAMPLTSTQPSIGLKAGSIPTATTTGFGGFGAQPTSATAVVPPVSKSIGLGGVDFSSVKNDGKGTSGDSKSDSKSVKSTDVPMEILTTVDSFKKYVKEQKGMTEDITRMSSKPLLKVDEETAGLRKLVSVISNGIYRHTSTLAVLKQESARDLKNAEIAKQTKDIPAGMQYENTAPTEYFQRLLVEFERRMLFYKRQIEELEHHLMALNHSSPLSPNELAIMIKKMHETFVALAAQLHTINEDVKILKEQFLHHRKTAFGDSRDIFNDRLKCLPKDNNRNTSYDGMSAFSHIPNAAAVAMVTALNRNQQPPAPPTLGIGNPLAATSAPLFGSTLNSSSLLNQNTSFGFGANQFGNKGSTGAVANPKNPSIKGFGSSFSFGTPSAVQPLGK